MAKLHLNHSSEGYSLMLWCGLTNEFRKDRHQSTTNIDQATCKNCLKSYHYWQKKIQ